MGKTSYDIAKKHRMLDKSEVDLIKKCANTLPKKPICVNIGSGAGTSVIAVLEERPEAIFFSIDKLPIPEEKKRIAECGLDIRRVYRVLGKSQHVGVFFPFKVDWVFVDGAHDNKSVNGDIIHWRKHLKKGGIMLNHDYHHFNLPDLSPMIDRLMKDCKVIGEARYLIAHRTLK